MAGRLYGWSGLAYAYWSLSVGPHLDQSEPGLLDIELNDGLAVFSSRYFHRTLNPVKLVDIGFTPVRRGDTVSRMARRFALPSETSTPGFREMCKEDIPQVLDLMKRYMAKFDLEQKFDTEEEIEHWFISGRGTGEYQKGRGREGQVAWAYVVEVSICTLCLSESPESY